MTLDASYLEYPKRGPGMDHGLYPWSNLFLRPPVRWSNGKGLAIWIVVSLEWFPIVPADVPFRAPGHMQTTYPDFRHYTAREYGTRVGVYRLLDAFARAGARVSFAVNSAIAKRYPALIADITRDGHELIAHSTDMNGTIATGLDEAAERALIAQSLDTLERVSGKRPRGWHSIARSQSWNTPGLLVAAGVDYMCDWVNDEMPFAMSTPLGPIVNLPLNHELGDRQILTVQQQSVGDYAEQIRDACTLLEQEAERFGGRMLPLAVTPYIMGLPYRIADFETLLAWLGKRPHSFFATGSQILDDWQAAQKADIDR
jgi:hypothetical protein